jgi:hypothetical protein
MLLIERYRFQWPRGLKRRSEAACLLRLCVRIPPEAWMFVCCECCVLSGRGLCDELITRPEESYRLCCVVVCDLETREWGRPGPQGAVAPKTNKQNWYIDNWTCSSSVHHIASYLIPFKENVWIGWNSCFRFNLIIVFVGRTRTLCKSNWGSPDYRPY